MLGLAHLRTSSQYSTMFYSDSGFGVMIVSPKVRFRPGGIVESTHIQFNRLKRPERPSKQHADRPDDFPVFRSASGIGSPINMDALDPKGA